MQGHVICDDCHRQMTSLNPNPWQPVRHPQGTNYRQAQRPGEDGRTPLSNKSVLNQNLHSAIVRSYPELGTTIIEWNNTLTNKEIFYHVTF